MKPSDLLAYRRWLAKATSRRARIRTLPPLPLQMAKVTTTDTKSRRNGRRDGGKTVGTN